MRSVRIRLIIALAGICLLSAAAYAQQTPLPDNLRQVAQQLGVSGQMQEGAMVVHYPRSDLKVTINGEKVPTALGLVSWAAWKNVGKETMVMGDFVLLEKEIDPFMSALEKGGMRVTGLHNHFLGEQPRVMYMHVDGMGRADALAKTLQDALGRTGTPKPKAPAKPSYQMSMDTKSIERIMGLQGKASGDVFKITVGRSGVTMSGVEITSSMGLNSWAGFMGTNDRAHVAGDIVMTAVEVNQVIKALRAGNISVVAVHNHMLDEQPRMFFLHYWGTGRSEDLARTVKAAFDNVKGPVK